MTRPNFVDSFEGLLLAGSYLSELQLSDKGGHSNALAKVMGSQLVFMPKSFF